MSTLSRASIRYLCGYIAVHGKTRTADTGAAEVLAAWPPSPLVYKNSEPMAYRPIEMMNMELIK
jgi:hypothetical protein